jgi:AraC-like DNA-binding protein
MPSSAPSVVLEECTVDGPRTRRWVLEAADCRALGVHRVARLGLDEARHPYRRVRLRPEGSFVMIGVEGSGRVLLDGRWTTLAAGWACLAPPRVPNAFHAVPGKTWRFCWVRYDEPAYVAPLVSADSPVKVQVCAEQWLRVWEGLRCEWETARDPAALHHWLELAHHGIRRLSQPWRQDERLRLLWRGVGENLAQDWTLASLAHAAHMSPEHFRRLCWKELGRSPMAHLTSLRIQAAQTLLVQSNDKQEVVAAAVGYRSPIAFARAFKRWTGSFPSDYRASI